MRLEKAEQADTVQLFSVLGKVYVLGTRRKKGDHQGTMQTPGISDLVVFLRPSKLLTAAEIAAGHPSSRPRLVMTELKREKNGEYSDDQLTFRQWCHDAGVDYIGGAFNVVVAWLVREKYVRADQFSHEHLTLVPSEDR